MRVLGTVWSPRFIDLFIIREEESRWVGEERMNECVSALERLTLIEFNVIRLIPPS